MPLSFLCGRSLALKVDALSGIFTSGGTTGVMQIASEGARMAACGIPVVGIVPVGLKGSGDKFLSFTPLLQLQNNQERADGLRSR